MKNLEKFFIYIIIIFFSIGSFKVFEKVNTLRTESYKNKIINDYAKKLKGCFDLENKNQRSINESIGLIKYCMREFVIDQVILIPFKIKNTFNLQYKICKI